MDHTMDEQHVKQRKEQFEREMTEVRLNLKGEYARFTGEKPEHIDTVPAVVLAVPEYQEFTPSRVAVTVPGKATLPALQTQDFIKPRVAAQGAEAVELPTKAESGFKKASVDAPIPAKAEIAALPELTLTAEKVSNTEMPVAPIVKITPKDFTRPKVAAGKTAPVSVKLKDFGEFKAPAVCVSKGSKAETVVIAPVQPLPVQPVVIGSKPDTSAQLTGQFVRPKVAAGKTAPVSVKLKDFGEFKAPAVCVSKGRKPDTNVQLNYSFRSRSFTSEEVGIVAASRMYRISEILGTRFAPSDTEQEEALNANPLSKSVNITFDSSKVKALNEAYLPTIETIPWNPPLVNVPTIQDHWEQYIPYNIPVEVRRMYLQIPKVPEADILSVAIPKTEVPRTGIPTTEIPRVEIGQVRRSVSPVVDKPQLPDNIAASISTILDIFARECG